MYTKAYYQIQLETLEALRNKCNNKETLAKLEKAISKYKSYIERYDSIKQTDECHCQLCVMQG